VIDGTDSCYSLDWTAEGARAFGEAIKDHPTLKTLVVNLKTHLDEEKIIGFLYGLTGSAEINSLHVDVY
jgi:hypothetical protein